MEIGNKQNNIWINFEERFQYGDW